MCGAAAAVLAAFAVAVGAVAPAGAQSQGPMNPALVVSDASFGMDPWNSPQNGAVADNVPTASSDPGAFNSQFLKATGFGFAIPNAAVINGLQVAVAKFGISCSDAAVRIVKGGTIGATDRSDASMLERRRRWRLTTRCRVTG